MGMRPSELFHLFGDLSNLSGVIYYVGMQNLVFNSLQQALFALACCTIVSHCNKTNFIMMVFV